MTDEPRELGTRERLLRAAIDVFSDVGFAGARVDAIAQRAGCNKQLLYHHFRDKEGLHKAVIETVLAEKPPVLSPTLSGVLDVVRDRYRTLACERRWIRMLEWEALERGDQPTVGCEERRAHLQEELERIRELQASGEVRSDAPAEMLLLQVMGMAMLPSLLPQLVVLATGSPPDEAFQDRYAALLRDTLARVLEPGPKEG
jgi:AcrR family transcriptional regulator